MCENRQIRVEDEHLHSHPSSRVVEPILVLQAHDLLQPKRPALVLMEHDGVEPSDEGTGAQGLTAHRCQGRSLHLRRVVRGEEPPAKILRSRRGAVQGLSRGAQHRGARGVLAQRVLCEPAQPVLRRFHVRRDIVVRAEALGRVQVAEAVVGVLVPRVAGEVHQQRVRVRALRLGPQVRMFLDAGRVPPPNLLQLHAADELVVPQHAVHVVRVRRLQVRQEKREDRVVEVGPDVFDSVDVFHDFVACDRELWCQPLVGRALDHAANVPLHLGHVRDVLVHHHRAREEHKVEHDQGEGQAIASVPLLQAQVVHERLSLDLALLPLLLALRRNLKQLP
mmetsp:Transcript_37790/g.97723  ORF Transcript_37790/g.97723 Transcript_37790/m.97723 type:complete len:336 (+) Transcript_37790:1694-2701(+)